MIDAVRSGSRRKAGGTLGAASPASWRQTWVSGLRRNWLATIFLVAGLVLRVLVQLAYRPALFYQDTTRYLYHAGGNDPVGYRVPLRAILLVGNLDLVVVIQHLLGLAIAVALYCLLVRRGVARWLAALAIVPVLFDAYQLQLEQMVMPDVLFEALIVAGLVLLLWRPVITWKVALAAGLMLGAAVPVRQVGEILVLPALCYVLLFTPGWRTKAARAVVLCAAFAVPFLAYCTTSYVVHGSFALSHTGVTTTYGRMAYAADCSTLKLTAAQRPLCPTPAQQRLGPDGLLHDKRSPLKPVYRRLPHAQASALVEGFNGRVIRQQPGRVLGAVGRDFAKLFALTRDTAPGDDPISRWQFQLHYPYMWPHASRHVLHVATHQFGGGKPAVWLPVARFLRSYQLRGGYTPGPLLLACLIGGAAAALVALRRRLSAPRRELTRACFLIIVTAVSVLLVSDVFVYSWRYQLPALATLPAAGALALACLPWRRLRVPAAMVSDGVDPGRHVVSVGDSGPTGGLEAGRGGLSGSGSSGGPGSSGAPDSSRRGRSSGSSAAGGSGHPGSASRPERLPGRLRQPELLEGGPDRLGGSGRSDPAATAE